MGHPFPSVRPPYRTSLDRPQEGIRGVIVLLIAPAESLEALPSTETASRGIQVVGIIVEAVKEVLRISREQIKPAPPGLLGLGEQYVSGVVRLDSRLLILLNICELVIQDAATRGSLAPVAVS